MIDEPLSAYVRRTRGQPDEGSDWLADRIADLETDRTKALAALRETDSWLWNKIVNGVYGPVGD